MKSREIETLKSDIQKAIFHEKSLSERLRTKWHEYNEPTILALKREHEKTVRLIKNLKEKLSKRNDA